VSEHIRESYNLICPRRSKSPCRALLLGYLGCTHATICLHISYEGYPGPVKDQTFAHPITLYKENSIFLLMELKIKHSFIRDCVHIKKKLSLLIVIINEAFTKSLAEDIFNFVMKNLNIHFVKE